MQAEKRRRKAKARRKAYNASKQARRQSRRANALQGMLDVGRLAALATILDIDDGYALPFRGKRALDGKGE